MFELVHRDKDYEKHKNDPDYLATKKVPPREQSDTKDATGNEEWFFCRVLFACD